MRSIGKNASVIYIIPLLLGQLPEPNRSVQVAPKSSVFRIFLGSATAKAAPMLCQPPWDAWPSPKAMCWTVGCQRRRIERRSPVPRQMQTPHGVHPVSTSPDHIRICFGHAYQTSPRTASVPRNARAGPRSAKVGRAMHTIVLDGIHRVRCAVGVGNGGQKLPNARVPGQGFLPSGPPFLVRKGKWRSIVPFPAFFWHRQHARGLDSVPADLMRP